MNFLRATIIATGLLAAGIKPVWSATCELLFAEDSSSGSQKRMRIFVVSDSKSGDERISTAKTAAISAIKATGYDYVDVFLTPPDAPKVRAELNSSSSVAWAKFAPAPNKIPFMDERWQIVATENKPISKNWYSHEIELGSEQSEEIAVIENLCNFSNLPQLLDR